MMLQNRLNGLQIVLLPPSGQKQTQTLTITAGYVGTSQHKADHFDIISFTA